ncbi:MAG: aminotransferase class I/II-fold pyridoxal phosphate-dependent enzyme [Christensenellales bacterium]|jgi:cystathionine beta-lyase family protein involved in aluminum resistance
MSISELIKACEEDCAPIFRKLDAIEQINTQKVLDAFREERVSARHFAPTTGYGYDDIGRDTLGRIFAKVFRTEDAIVRPQITCGTHALALCLYGVLRPGDAMIAATGKPYDTLEEVIGLAGTPGRGSLAEYGIQYKQVELKDDFPDIDGILAAIDPSVKLVAIQRSRGYAWRASLGVDDIDKVTAAIHEKHPNVCVMVDNCYGEFTDDREPNADLLAGSLIKNPGGGIAPTGGYIAGKSKWLDLVSCRLTCPGIAAEVGSYADSYRPFYQGLFMAPHTTMQAVKTAVLAARVFEEMGFRVHPKFDASRTDIIQAIRFDDRDKMLSFCKALQAASPVDSNAVPEPWDMPGYQDPVIMAAGTFVSGASIELSADGPVKPPYILYMQGGLTYVHGKIAIERAAEAIR